jgi:hypothetical protein
MLVRQVREIGVKVAGRLRLRVRLRPLAVANQQDEQAVLTANGAPCDAAKPYPLSFCLAEYGSGGTTGATGTEGTGWSAYE